MSAQPTIDELLDAPTLARGVQIGRPHVGERVFARDRAETGDGNGDRWLGDPDAPRPATPGFAN